MSISFNSKTGFQYACLTLKHISPCLEKDPLPPAPSGRIQASRNSSKRVNQTDGTVRDDEGDSESDVSIVEETPDVGELLQPGTGTVMVPTAG